jgi:hypothetical protein
MRIVIGVGDLVRKIGDGQVKGQVLGGWTIEMSVNTVCGLHRAQGDKEHEFFD